MIQKLIIFMHAMKVLEPRNVDLKKIPESGDTTDADRALAYQYGVNHTIEQLEILVKDPRFSQLAENELVLNLLTEITNEANAHLEMYKDVSAGRAFHEVIKRKIAYLKQSNDRMISKSK